MPPKQVKPGRGGVFAPISGQFSKDRQPSPKAKSEGLKRFYRRASLIDDVFGVFCADVTSAKDGKTVPGIKGIALRMRDYLLQDSEKGISDRKAAVMLRFFEMFQQKDADGLFPPEQEGEEPSGPLDFETFCLRCGYPKPFAQQVEMADFIYAGGIRLLLGARNYGKTDYGAICGMAYQIYLNPALTFLFMTKEEDRGMSVIAEVSRCLRCVGVKLAVDRKKEMRVRGLTGKDPSVVILSVRSRGFRGRHPKYVVCDDIITPDDTSPAERRRVFKVYEEVVKLADNVTIMGQPAHAKDLYAELRGKSGVKKLEMPHGTIPQLDKDLEAQRMAGVTEESIRASYFLEIAPEASMPFSTVEITDQFPMETSIAFVDPSMKGIDFTAVAIGRMFMNRFITAGFCFKRSWDNCLEELQALFNAFHVGKAAFETNGLGNLPVRLLREQGAPVTGWNSSRNKHARIMNAGTFRNNIALSTFIPKEIANSVLKDANRIFIAQVTNYDYNAEHDDGPDAMSNLFDFAGVLRR